MPLSLYFSVQTPIVQTVPNFGEQEPFWEREYPSKSGPKPSLEMTEENEAEERKTAS